MSGKEFIEMMGENVAYACFVDYLDSRSDVNIRDYENLNVYELFEVMDKKLVEEFFDKEREDFAQFIAEHTFDVVIKCELNEKDYLYDNIVAFSEEDAFDVAKNQFANAFLSIISKEEYEKLKGGNE